jgi:hypothetical protein
MIPFNLRECLESGIAVTGCPGSGKTTLLKQIVDLMVTEGYVSPEGIHEPITVYVLDVSKAWNSGTAIKNVIEVKEGTTTFQTVNTIFDLSGLSFNVKRRWVNSFVKSIYDAHVNGTITGREFIVFEECHTYLPTGALRASEKFEPIINLVTVGRNFKLRYAFATQFPAMCDANLFKSPQQRYFGWTTEFNDVSRIRSYFPRKRKNELEDELRELGKLRFIYQYGNTIETFKIEHHKQPIASPTNNETPMRMDKRGFSISSTFNYIT